MEVHVSCSLTILFEVVSVFVNFEATGQVLEGLPCQVNNVKSQCVSIQDCEAVKQELLKPQLTQETKNFLKSLSCGFANNNYYVCCPQRISSASNPQQTLSAATNEELYRQKFLVAPQCGLANVSLPRVVGGVPTKPGDFPWLVALGYQNKQNPSIPRWLCGGSLITYKHVLTAAHCIRNDLYVVRAGEYNLYSDNDGAQPLDLRIAKMTIYEGYNKSRASNDIALLTLERNIEGYHQIRPICLPWEPEIRTKSFLADTLYIIGWGQVQFRGPSSEIPLIASLKELPIDYCSRVYSSVADIDDRIMCVGDIQYKKDACSGDSGVQEGLPCDVNGIRGECISIYDCEVISRELSRPGITQETRNFVKSLACGFANNRYYVCCPSNQQQRGFSPVPDETTPQTNGGDREELYRRKFLVAPQCGVTNVSLPRVVGGVPTKLGDFPWLAALGYQNKDNPSVPKWLCGGTLITYRHVLTAAHCLRNDLYIVRLGEFNLYSDNDGASPIDVNIANIKKHEGYSKARASNDIAILTLKRNVEGFPRVLPICLPWESELRTKSLINYYLYVIGWGKVQFQGPSSDIPLIASIKELPTDLCSKAYASQADIDDRIMCVGDLKYQKDACSGDSGGPLMFGKTTPKQKYLTFYQVAVVSYGHKCAEPGYPGVYTRVTAFLDWIANNLD